MVLAQSRGSHRRSVPPARAIAKKSVIFYTQNHARCENKVERLRGWDSGVQLWGSHLALGAPGAWLARRRWWSGVGTRAQGNRRTGQRRECGVDPEASGVQSVHKNMKPPLLQLTHFCFGFTHSTLGNHQLGPSCRAHLRPAAAHPRRRCTAGHRSARRGPRARAQRWRMCSKTAQIWARRRARRCRTALRHAWSVRPTRPNPRSRSCTRLPRALCSLMERVYAPQCPGLAEPERSPSPRIPPRAPDGCRSRA